MRRLTLPLIVAVAGAALLALLAFGLSEKASVRTLDDAFAHGEHPPAPVGALHELNGPGTASLAAYRGKVVVLNFWASWCDPCKAEAPLLENAQRTLQQHNATVLGVTYLDTTPDSQSFVSHYGLTYPNLRDVDGRFAHAYGTEQLPESFVVDRRGRVAGISRGEIDSAFLARAVSLAKAS